MRRPAWATLAAIAVQLVIAAAPAHAAQPPCTITGTPGDDHALEGTGGNDVICGLGGNDTIIGHAGDDYLAGGPGDDTLTGGAGADTLSGDADTDTGNYADHTGGIASVTVDIDDVADDGNVFDGNSADNVLTSTENLIGTTGKDTLTGSAAANLFDGGFGADRYVGLGGSDTVTYAGRAIQNAGVAVDIDNVADDGNATDGPPAARDNVTGDVENLIGTIGLDRLVGSPAANTFEGGEGGDTLDGRAGPDVLAGQEGSDTVTYADRTSAVQVDPDGAPDDGNADDGPAGARDTVTLGTENIIAGAGGDTLRGNASANSLTGLGGSDVLRGLNGDDILSGGAGNDTIDGGAHTDQLVESGNVNFTLTNTSLTGLGTDTLAAIERAKLTGGASANTINASAFSGTTTLGGGGHNDLVIGGSSSDKVTGGNGDDTLRGGPGGDSLGGGEGADSLTGFAGDDQLAGGPGPDVLSGVGGRDTAIYTDHGNNVTVDIDDVADDGNSTDGAAGARDNVKSDVENLTGGPGNDTLIGSAADNVLNGRSGADTFVGLGGIDTVTYEDRSGRGNITVDIDDVADDGGSADEPGDNVLTDVENLIGHDTFAYGRDRLTGSASNNTLDGRSGPNTLKGMDGDDTMLADNQSGDIIDCDGGTNPGTNDVAYVDPGESAPNCETVIVVP
jgi:Ca2+-binding RTX toxin-like protein